MRCIIELNYDSEEEASLVFNSTRPDDDNFVRTKIREKTVIATFEAPTVESMRRAIDDFLACVSVAERSRL